MKTAGLFALAAFSVVAMAAAFPADSSEGGDGRLRAVATVLPLAEFARDIAGGRAEVVLLLPPGTDVHTWQPRVSDIRTLEKADLLISVGLGLEPWLESLVRGAAAGRLRRFEASAGLDLIAAAGEDHEDDHRHGAFDPHVWLDFTQDEAIVDGLVRAFSSLAPADAGFFARNAEALKARLRALDASFREALAPFRGREFILAGHAAFAYLARRYELRQVAVYGPNPDAAPTPRETAEIISRAASAGVKTIFYEWAAGDKMARLIAAEIGADVRVLYPGHNLDPAQSVRGLTFFRLMEENRENLAHGLSGR